MAITWNTPAGNLLTAEEEYKFSKIYIEFEPAEAELIIYKDGEETVVDGTVENPCISGGLPNGVLLTKIRDGRYSLDGILPIVNEKTTFNFTLKARYIDEYNNIEYSDRYFSITVLNKETKFDENQEQPFEFTESIYSMIRINLLNPEGNEEFIKVSGKLPKGLVLADNGLIYGIPENDGELQPYHFVVGIKRDGKIIFDKEFTATLLQLSTIKEPIWITESGLLGSLNYGDIPEKTLMVKAFDPNEKELTYHLTPGYILPEGLWIDNSTGQIKGKCDSQYSRTWTFKVTVSNDEYNVDREFSLITNEITSDKNISWDMDTLLGNYKIGDNVFIQFKTNSNYNVSYTLLSNNLPKGLSFKNGIITGLIDYQDLGNYMIAVEANNGYKSIQKQFILTLTKGLGKNSLKCYLYINHEYDNDYNEMIGYFNRNYAYEPTNPLYKLSSTPIIDICNCTCFDKVLMKYLLYFNESLNVEWGKTICKKYLIDDAEKYSVFYKNIIEQSPKGEIEYWGGNRVYITYDPKSSTGYYLEGTKTEIEPTGSIYRETDLVLHGAEYIVDKNKKIYIRILNEKNYYRKDNLFVINEKEPIYIEEYQERDKYTNKLITLYRNYILDNGKKIYIEQCKEGMIMDRDTNEYLNLSRDDVQIFKDDNYARMYFIDNKSTSLAMPSTNSIRDELNSTIYVTKNENNNVLYDSGSQEIIDENGEYENYTLYYDDKNKAYYVKYNGEDKYVDVYAVNNEHENPTPVYASIENNKWIEKVDNKTASVTEFDNTYDNMYAETLDYKYVIDGNETKFKLVPVKVRIQYLNTDVDYQQYLVFEKGTQNLQENIIFTLSWNPDIQFIILNGKVHLIRSIDKPWMYLPENNEQIGYDKKIVLPYISDDDIININSKPYIKFFDSSKESLPSWKTRIVDEWKPNTFYIEGDMFQHLDVYYIVTNEFKSGSEFVIYNDYMRALSKREKESYDKPYYYPTMNLFYGTPNSNLTNLTRINNKENDGYYWTGRKFCFFEVHFSPMYNNNIDNFSIDFYNYKNNRSPEFQLI